VATDVSALRLHARYDEGSGPVMVFLHGINADAQDWRKVIDHIGPGYRFIAFDLLGFGESPKPLDIEYNADELALIIDNSLVDLGVTEPFLLAGYSLGGDLAVRYASTYPHKLRRLFLLSAPFYLPPTAFGGKNFGSEFLQALLYKFMWKVLATSRDNDSVIYKLVTGKLERPLAGAFRTDDLETGWEVMGLYLRNTINKATFVDDLPNLTMPTVFALGIRDPIVRPDQTPALKRLKPDMEIRRIVGLSADHMLLWNIPGRVADEIMRDEIRELNVAYRGGSGEPLVILPSMEVDSRQWTPAAEALSHGNDVAMIDLLGFGQSPAPLSSHYTIADQAAAVLSTVDILWGPDTRVRFGGAGIGAVVALACAATAPARSAGVIAISPTLLAPGTSLDDIAHDEAAAELIATLEKVDDLSGDERAAMMTAEKVERRLVPVVRSLRAAVATDATALLSHVPAPVRFVVPTEDTASARAYLAGFCGDHDGFTLAEPDGDRAHIANTPAAAVRALDPENAAAIAAAESMPPARRASRRGWLDAVSGVENTMLRNGAFSLLAALVLALLHPIPNRILIGGAAIWVAVSAISTIAGAMGMRRGTDDSSIPWVLSGLPWVLVGAVGVAFAFFVKMEPATSMRILALGVAAYAAYRGGADLFIAWKIKELTRPRWLLVVSGVAGVVTALSILFGPNHGRIVTRIVLQVYLLVTGGSLVAYAMVVKLRTRARVKELMGR